MRSLILLLAMFGMLDLYTPAFAEDENTGPNINVAREIVGTLRLQTKSDKRYRGAEEWRIFVHPDGARTMILSKDFIAANALQIMTAHVDANFRPVDVYATYWVPDGYRGSIRVAVDGETLRAVSEGPGGTLTENVVVPEEISVVTHGESMNGWYLSQGDRDEDGRHEATYYIFSPTRDGSEMVRGRLGPASFQYLGQETITVPAGTFETERYLLTNIEMWVTGEHRILVKQSIVDEDKEYVLTRLEEAKPE
ncbi:MAG: hypothetical protein GKS03_09615 [Alphaproteobacteria bacterium]|nr:hypothetical protein [Alphaproteobacteria bacterium]